MMIELCCAVLLVAAMSSCETLDMNRLEGTWYEQYDPTVFVMEGVVEYNFDGNNHYRLHIYDYLSDIKRDYSGSYVLDPHNKTITLNPHTSDGSRVTFNLVKLNSREMEWQKAGTSYAIGTWGADYRHFVKK